MNRYIYCFVKCSGIALFAVAVAKMIAGSGHDRILLRPDPILGIPFRLALIIAATLELVVSGICLLTDSVRMQLVSIAWLATSFAIYHFGLWVASVKYCPCLGSITDALHISPQTANIIAECITGFLLVGSYGSLIFKWSLKYMKP
jgi:hypothetical protein